MPQSFPGPASLWAGARRRRAAATAEFALLTPLPASAPRVHVLLKRTGIEHLELGLGRLLKTIGNEVAHVRLGVGAQEFGHVLGFVVRKAMVGVAERAVEMRN